MKIYGKEGRDEVYLDLEREFGGVSVVMKTADGDKIEAPYLAIFKNMPEGIVMQRLAGSNADYVAGEGGYIKVYD